MCVANNKSGYYSFGHFVRYQEGGSDDGKLTAIVPNCVTLSVYSDVQCCSELCDTVGLQRCAVLFRIV